MALPNPKQDLPRSPQNFSSEFLQYWNLSLKQTAWGNYPDASYTSPSSGIRYPTSGNLNPQTEQELHRLLGIALTNYIQTASDFNSLITELQKVIDNVNVIEPIVKQLQSDVVDLQALTSTFVEAIAFANQSNYYAWTNFKNADEEIIDEANSTVTFDVPNGVAKFDSTGNNKLVLNDYTYGSNFSEINMRLYPDEIKVATPNQNYNNVNQIEVSTNEYTLDANDKLYIDDTEIDITNVTGGLTNIDFETTPGDITAVGTRKAGHKSSVWNRSNNYRYEVWRSSGFIKLARYDGTTKDLEIDVITSGATSESSIAVHELTGRVYVMVVTSGNVAIRIYDEDLSYISQTTAFSDSSVSVGYMDITGNNGVVIYGINTTPFIQGIKQFTLSVGGDISLGSEIGLGIAGVSSACLATTGSDFFFCTSASTSRANIYTNINVPGFSNIGGGLYRLEVDLSTYNDVTHNHLIFEKRYGSNTGRKYWIRPNNPNYSVLYSDDNFENIATSGTFTGTSPTITETVDGNIVIYYDNSGIKSRTILNGQTGLGSQVAVKTGSQPFLSKEQPDTVITPVHSYVDSGIKAGGEYSIGGGFVLTLSQNVTVTTSDNLPITTQFSPQQASDDFSFSSATSNYLQYSITGLNTALEDIEVGGKSVDLDILTYNIF